MFCKKCGTQIHEDAKFCKKCGTPITGLRDTNLNSEIQSEENMNNVDKDTNKPLNLPDKVPNGKKTIKEIKAEKKAERTSLSSVKNNKKVLIILIVVFTIAGITGTLTYFGIVNIPTVEECLISVDLSDKDEVNKVEHPDADAYYKNNSKIISQVNVKDSKLVQSETELSNNIENRGFGEYPVSSEYSMDGEYYEAIAISDSSSDKHPMYQTYYQTAKEELWVIFVVNGSVMAIPMSYNMQSDLGVQVIISESETVTSYDSSTNKFYETIPNETELIVKIIDKIDAESLEKLTFEVIDGL